MDRQRVEMLMYTGSWRVDMHAGMQVDRQADMRVDRQAQRKAGRVTGRQACGSEKLCGRQVEYYVRIQNQTK